MSKLIRPFCRRSISAAAAVSFAALASTGLFAQDLEATIEIGPSGGAARISGRFTGRDDGPRNLSFVTSAIGAEGLGARIDSVELTDNEGKMVSFRRLNAGEFSAQAAIRGFKYSLDLTPFNDPRSAAHASWLADEFGVVFLDDVLPRSSAAGGRRALVRFAVPEGWQVTGTDPAGARGGFIVIDRGRSVFAIGKGIRRLDPPRKGEPTLLVRGTWLHSDAEAAEMMQEIYREYLKIFGRLPSESPMAVLFPFPQKGVGHGTWEAETRGDTVLIASGGMPFENQAKQRLHEQLRHEIFHLWLPNGVGLTGPYDWLYEGFAMYISLKTAVSLGRIRFDDMLDTLSRAYRIDRSGSRRRSLIESSRDRFAGAETQVYARGMLAAFLSDLALMSGPGKPRSAEEFLRGFFQKHALSTVRADGNAAVLEAMNAVPALRNVTNQVILGSAPVDWDILIANAGLKYSSNKEQPGLIVASGVNGRQRSLLRKLGYNGR